MLKRLKNEYAVENKSQNIKLVDDNNAEKLSYPYLEEGKLPNARQCMYRVIFLQIKKKKRNHLFIFFFFQCSIVI